MEYEDIAFSSDGILVATLGGLPDFDLVIWDWSDFHFSNRSVFSGLAGPKGKSLQKLQCPVREKMSHSIGSQMKISALAVKEPSSS